ncbi:hypothetical protein AARAC_010575 [Aspergillus arachidicola]|uniref:Aminoglycoside phosphotransferase domain-containing protein n=1 Tax=Aspergillus arachidicola TaxID=656916 RepID=A0A2G7FZ48_9EURO|nr:hypothetical protein AARAC_010575 [Aspergillus arachidicola]
MSRETESETIRLPTVAEIETATEIISTQDTSAKVVRVNKHFAVKMGHGVTLVEAENIRFLAANSKVPVPKVHAAFKDPGTKKTYIIMQYFHDMNLAIIEKLRQTESEPYIRLLRNMVNRTLNGHRTIFTHGDLQPKNIMDEKLRGRDGCPEFKITLLDWESAGWYPEFWDFCNATIACRFKPDWLELVPDILDQYPVEFLMMQVVYSSVFY